MTQHQNTVFHSTSNSDSNKLGLRCFFVIYHENTSSNKKINRIYLITDELHEYSIR
ncbi:hypothetical protein NARC_40016 [Candidatus Nitrosocosmicus arcticus]|uniref:Uncharacterized protein n=1 Tax=Candidatus Nitrosocosmicus arcticus TaxID=2035267 RepID=A0A557SWS9_9ARCH|nr:hypothetical protein NARC_40016 [Candidatus Nitrosocosmicus arcticus]